MRSVRVYVVLPPQLLLLDLAAGLPFAVPVKSALARVVEFCSRLD